MVVAGIDPGSWFTGIAFISITNRVPNIIHTDILKIDSNIAASEGLSRIYDFVRSSIKTYCPLYCSIEIPVYGQNPVSMLKLARSQAAAMIAVNHQKLKIIEFLPKQIKKIFTGNGNSSKEQVRYMVEQIFQYKAIGVSEHEIDAVSVAWCGHIYRYGIPTKKNKAKEWSQYVINNRDRVI